MDERTCSIEGCSRSVRVVSRGWCAMHYQRWQRHGDTGPGTAHRVHGSTAAETRRCEFPGCTRKYISKGPCASHNWQRNTGRELTALPKRRPAKPHDRNPQDEKQCRTCLLWLDPDLFNRNASAKDGLQGSCRSCGRDAQRKVLYRLPPGRYAEMLASQGGTCAICKQADNNGFALSVDHDHGCCPETGTCGECVRGLVCTACNHGLGKFRDSPELLRAAAAYLEWHASR
ncbi:endonuclease VII domain-containing protein [Streptomyces sp. NPDC006678]|uniref:endonuclease VII domain-containing protein n=1 Tax=Streptomyces sp. NPDC006678 TaxID=3157185 RepID=UPI003404E66B